MTSPGALRLAPGLGGALAVLVAAALAVLVRVLGYEYVFVGEEIVFPPADPQYHLRRALYTMVRFPDVLLFDPYINHPGGAPVPWPPLFDFALGALGRLAGGEVRDLERVAAFAGPVCAAIAVVPVYLAGVRLGSRRVGAVAALLFALLPISAVYTRIGNADHHGAVGMIGAWLLLAVLSLVDPTASRRALVARGALLFFAQTAMLLTWHGSLLYLAPAEALLLLAGLLGGRAGLLGVQAAAALASTAVIGAMLAVSPTPLGGPYSSIALSGLHALAMGAVAVTAGGLFAGLRAGRATTVSRRFLWAGGAGALFLLALIVLPGPREGLSYAFRFLTLGDEVGAITGEQTPLFATSGRLAGPPATHSWGLFAYALPLAPLAGLLARRRGAGARAAGLALLGWGLVFCSLASWQRRYGNDAAPAAALSFALALVAAADRVVAAVGRRVPARGRVGLAAALAAAAVGLLFLPPIAALHLPRAAASRAAWQADRAHAPGARASVAHTLHHFAGEVGAVTPPTAGFVDAGAGPAYGVLAHANLGHALQYRARRATATDPFWWYIGRENWDRSHAFLEATDEAEALALARALAGRYVVTMPGLGRATVVGRLHERDGRGVGGAPPLRHFRLVTEAPAGGLPVGALFGARSDGRVPYKLFEIVAGATIELSAEPGETVSAAVEVVTPTGRRFVHRVRAEADAAGRARLRVAYPTRSSPPAGPEAGPRIARTTGPYRVRVGGAVLEVDVDEAQVRSGARVRPVADAGPEAASPVNRS